MGDLRWTGVAHVAQEGIALELGALDGDVPNHERGAYAAAVIHIEIIVYPGMELPLFLQAVSTAATPANWRVFQIDSDHSGLISSQKRWNRLSNPTKSLFVYYSHGKCAPLYVSTVTLKRAKLQSDSALCNLRYSGIAEISTTAEKLRYLRCQRNLFQHDVADAIGIYRSTYIGYEGGERDSYPLDKLMKIAELFHVELPELLDAYNRFLYDGQAGQLKAFRKQRELSSVELAGLLGVVPSTVRKWERGEIQMTKQNYERLLQVRG